MIQHKQFKNYEPDEKALKEDIRLFGYQDNDVAYIFSKKLELQKYFLQRFQVVDNYKICEEDALKHFIPMPKYVDVEGLRAYEIVFTFYNEETEMEEDMSFRILKEDFIYKEEYVALRESLLDCFTNSIGN